MSSEAIYSAPYLLSLTKTPEHPIYPSYEVKHDIDSLSKKCSYELTTPPDTYYVYALVNPLNNQIFYIGKGKYRRHLMHLVEAQTKNKMTEKNQIINEIHGEGLMYISIFLCQGVEEKIAIEIEEDFIRKYGRTFDGGCLSNIQLKGATTPPRGSPVPLEQAFMTNKIDKNVYKFTNKETGDSIKCTRVEFIREAGECSKTVQKIVKNGQYKESEWVCDRKIYGHIEEPILEIIDCRDESRIEGTVPEITEKLKNEGITKSQLWRLIDGTNSSTGCFRLPDTPIEETQFYKRGNHIKYDWIFDHKEYHENFYCMTEIVHNEMGGDRKKIMHSLHKLKNGKRFHYKLRIWMKGTSQEDILPNGFARTDKTYYRHVCESKGIDVICRSVDFAMNYCEILGVTYLQLRSGLHSIKSGNRKSAYGVKIYPID